MKKYLLWLTLMAWLVSMPNFDIKNSSNVKLPQIKSEKKEIINKTRENVLFTIDDGPSKYTTDIASTLDSLGYKWIFFVVSRWINEKVKQELVEILKMWHNIWNHSYSHPNFQNLNFEEAKYQIIKSDSIISSIYNTAWIEQKNKYIRYPYGIEPSNLYRDQINILLDSLWYEKPMFWRMDVDLRDWRWFPELEKIKKLKDGDLILLHERSYTPQTIREIVKSIDEKSWLDTTKYCADLLIE